MVFLQALGVWLICWRGVEALFSASATLGPSVEGHVSHLLLDFNTSASWNAAAKGVGPCTLRVEVNGTDLWQLSDSPSVPGCPFLLELPAFPAPESCLKDSSGFQLHFAGCLVKNYSYHLVLQIKLLAAHTGQLGNISIVTNSTTDVEVATAEVTGEIRPASPHGSMVVHHVPQYMDVAAFEGQAMSLIVQIARSNPSAGDTLLLVPSPVTLWSSKWSGGSCVARLNTTGNPSLVCNETALGLVVELGAAESFELHLRLPRGGATGLYAWHGWLEGSTTAFLEAPVVLGPHLRGSVRSATAAVPGILRLDLDVGADICMADPSLWSPAEVRVIPPLAMELPAAFLDELEPGTVLPPVDCLWQATTRRCVMTMTPSHWRRGLQCLFRGVVYTLQWETTTIPVITKSSGWLVEVEYPVPLDGSIAGSIWSSPVPALPSTFGLLPFLAAQPLRPVLGGQRQRETLLLVRFQTGNSSAYQDLLPLLRPSKVRLVWTKGMAFADFQSCNDLVLEMRNLPLLRGCKVDPWQRAPVGVELDFDGVLQSQEIYDLVLPVIAYPQELGTLRVEVRRESETSTDVVAEWGEVPSPQVFSGGALFDELSPVLQEVEVFTTDEDVLGLSPWQHQLLLAAPGKLKLMEVDLLGGPEETWQQNCDVLPSCAAGALALLPYPQLLLCDTTRLLQLELAPMGNETFMRLLGRFGNSLPQAGRDGLGSCEAVTASSRAPLRMFVVDGANHRVLQLKETDAATSTAASVLLPAASDLAQAGPLEVIYAFDEYELMVGQQGVNPLPARLWRVRLTDMEPLGFVFLQYSTFTDPNQIPLLDMDVLTAMAVGADSVWAAGEPRLLLRLDVATLRSKDRLDLPPSWGQVTAITEYDNILVLGTSQPALVIQVPLTSATLNSAVPSVWTLTAAQGEPRVATTISRPGASPIAVLGTDAQPPQLLLLPWETSVVLPGSGVKALAALTPVASMLAGTLAVATGEGGSRQTASLHLVDVGCNSSQVEGNISEECIFLDAWESGVSNVEVSSIIQDGPSIYISLMEGGVTQPRASTVRFTAAPGPILLVQENSSSSEPGRLVLVKSPDALRSLLVPPSGNSRFSILSMDSSFASSGLSVVSIFGLRIAGPLDVGYLTSTGNDGFSSPTAAVYADLPEPCLYVVDAGNHRLMQLSVSLTTMRYVTHFGVTGTPGSDLVRLNSPSAVAVGDGFRVYLLDAGNSRVLVLDTGETLGRLTVLQNLAVPVAAVFMTILPGAGLGPSTLWVASARQLACWSLAVPAQWSISAPSTAEAIAPLEVDVVLTQGQLSPGPGGGVLITAAPTLTWQLPPVSATSPLAVPPLCQADLTFSPSSQRVRMDCDFIGGGSGLPSPSVLLKVDQLDAAQQSRFTVRCSMPLGVAPNLFDWRSGAWTVALLGQGAGALRSRLLPPPAVPALAIPVAPQLTRPLVVVPPQGDARLGYDLTVHALLSPSALAVGSDLLAGQLSVHLPNGFVLEGASGCNVQLPDRCFLDLRTGVRLQADAPYLLRLQLQAPQSLTSTEWSLNMENAGPLKVTGSAENPGVKFTYGKLIPSSWQHFPKLRASPLKLGPAKLELTFRPYTDGSRSIIIVGPDTTILSCRSLTLTAPGAGASLASLASLASAGASLRCAAALSYAQVDGEEFSSSLTYYLQLEVQHLPGSWSPDGSANQVLRPSPAQANKTGLPWWRISFEDLDGHTLATARWIPGYPVWSETFSLSLDFLSLPMTPLPPGSSSMLEVTISSLEALGTSTPVYLGLYAPPGFTFDCNLGQEPIYLQPQLAQPQILTAGSCEGPGTLKLMTSEALAPKMDYRFRVAVLLPSSSGEVPDWYATLEAGEQKLGASALHRSLAFAQAIIVPEEEVQDTAVTVESTPAPSVVSTSGELHVDQLVVTEATDADGTSILGQWLLQQLWAPAGDLLSLEMRGVQADGLRIGAVLSAGGSLRLLAPAGYEFRQPFDPATVRVELPLAESFAQPRRLELYFQGITDTSNAIDLTVVVRAAVLGGEVEPWRLELWSAGGGELLGVQGNVGSFDRMKPFRRVVVASASQRVLGDFFDLAVFVVMPESGLEGTSNLLRLQAPATVHFASCDGGEADNQELARVPSGIAGSLQDALVSAASVMPLPDYSACSAGNNVLTLHLGGRRRGSGRGQLRASTVYGFSWRARRVVGREVPWRPINQAGFAGLGSELLLGDEAADSLEQKWRLAAFVGQQRRLASQVDQVQIAALELSPVWLLPTRPYYDRQSLLLVVFALGGRSYPATSKLRLQLHPIASARSASLTSPLLFLSCEQQQSLLRRNQWRRPLNLEEVPPEDPEGFGSQLLGQLTLVRFDGCRGSDDSGNNDNSSAEDLWMVDGELGLTLSLDTWLTPPGEEFLLQLGVAHAPKADLLMPMLSLEVIEEIGSQQRVLARAADLRSYALAEEMTLIRWSYSSFFRSAENALDLEFQPATTTAERQAEMLGFMLVAPPTYVFTKKSCEDFVLERSELVENLQTGQIESKPLFLKEMPLCEVLTSEWLFGGGYYQHQLTVYLPPLVGFRKEIRYRLKVTVLNPPLPLDDSLMMRFLRDKADASPKFSTSAYLTPSLNTWRVSTFLWASGDSGTGEVPYSLTNMGPLGRQGGITKLDEVSWNGFDLLLNT